MPTRPLVSTVLLITVGAAPASTQNREIDLAWTRNAATRLDGISAGDFAGRAVSGAGDVNGDGEVTVVQGACNMLNAAGPTDVGQTFTLTAHGTPFRLSLLFFGGFVAPAPLKTAVGPFWLSAPFNTWQLKQHDANGQWSVNITVPSGIGLSGLTVYEQLYEDPQPPYCNLSQLLATPIP